MTVSMATPPKPMAARSAAEQLAWGGYYAGALIVVLIIYGLLQERILQMPYDGIFFKYSVFLVFCNRLLASTWSMVMAYWCGESLQKRAPMWKYFVISLSNVYASTCQYEALKFISFPVQMLGRSFKMLPVMLWGIAISSKRYNLRDWIVAAAVTGGVAEFLMTGPVAASSAPANHVQGFIWLLAFLGLDGLTSTMQEKLFRDHKTSKYNQMCYVNFISACVSLGTLITTGTLVPSVEYCTNHPRFALDATMLSLSAVASQFYIYSLVKEFGALVFAATMNVRQVVSILLSYLAYHHDITWLQIGGLVMVFSALFYKSLVGVLHQTSYRSSTTEAVAAAVKAEKASFANQADLDARSYKAAEKA